MTNQSHSTHAITDTNIPCHGGERKQIQLRARTGAITGFSTAYGGLYSQTPYTAYLSYFDTTRLTIVSDARYTAINTMGGDGWAGYVLT